MKDEVHRVGDVLKDFLNNHTYIKYRINSEKAVKIWNEFEEKLLRERTEAIGFKNGTIYVRVSSPAIANELSLREKQYIDRINKLIGENFVKRISFKSGFVKRRNEKSVGDEMQKVKPPFNIIKRIDSIVKGVRDEELRARLRNLFIESYERIYKRNKE